jgi:hypothetical protein
MPKPSRRSIRIAGSLLAVAALVMSGQAGASAADTKAQPAREPAKKGPPVVSVNVTTQDGFDLPASVPAGLVTFRISTSEAGSFHGIQGFSLNHGVTLQEAMTDIDEALSGDPVRVAAGVKALTQDVTEIGGVVTNSYAAQEVTIPLEAGTYYWVDLNDVTNPPLTPRIHKLRAVGHFHWSVPPRFTSVIEATMVGMEPRFRAPRTMAHDATFLNVVTGDELHETVFRPVVPGTTDAYITNFYQAVIDGQPLPPSPWTGGQSGLQSLSPGRWAIVHINLPPGPYALICYVPSDETGLAHGWTGMHQMMNLT